MGKPLAGARLARSLQKCDRVAADHPTGCEVGEVSIDVRRNEVRAAHSCQPKSLVGRIEPIRSAARGLDSRRMPPFAERRVRHIHDQGAGRRRRGHEVERPKIACGIVRPADEADARIPYLGTREGGGRASRYQSSPRQSRAARVFRECRSQLLNGSLDSANQTNINSLAPHHHNPIRRCLVIERQLGTKFRILGIG